MASNAITRIPALRRVCLPVLACLLAACTASAPAPVEYRTRPPAAAAPAARATTAPPPAAASPAPAASPAGEAVVVQAQPVPSGRGVQVRPLSPGEPGAAAPGGPVRAQPQGLKRPYSEAAIAELKATDAGRPRAEAGEPKDPKPEPKAEPKAEAKPDARDARPEAKSAAAFAWPAKGRLIQNFVETRSTGIAIAGTPGDPVQAAADGRVIFSGPGPRGYGNLLIIRHDADTLSVYAHNRALLVKDGAQVRRGQQIAELGESGTDRPKLHFEIRRGGKPVDPIPLLPAR